MLADELDVAITEALAAAIANKSIQTYVGEHQIELAKQLCALTAQKECLLFSSATAALEVVLRAMGIGSKDEVALAGYDYPGNFWAIERVSATPVLIDVRKRSWGICPEALERTLAQDHNIKALIVSHLHGELQAIETLRQLCITHSILLIEDCCQAIGATTATSIPVGRSADAVLLSFGGGKTISCGRGGALLSQNSQLIQRARIASGSGSGPYAMSEIQAAIVLAQLPFLDRILGQSRSVFAKVNELLVKASVREMDPLVCTWPSQDCVMHTSYYQSGWLFSHDDQDQSSHSSEKPTNCELFHEKLKNVFLDLGVKAGSGFSGFHRRSSRRCRQISPLQETPARVQETFVVHHAIANVKTVARKLAQILNVEDQ